VLAIELMVAAQGLEFRRPEQSSSSIEKLVAAYRTKVSFYDTDRVLHDDMVASEQFLKDYQH
jgi:histidine ammonia-lyase